jgi:Protein of unknown function (DUF3306)
MSGDFLSRWSRRKLELRQGEPGPVAAPDASAEGAAAADSQEAAEDDDALTPEEIAALPKIEELTPETDIRMFLKKGVPELLRNSALRRMWSLDPAIRDYVSEAREYAYDWNVPGGVPGNGPLLPSDNVEEMLGQIFGDRPRLPELPAGNATAEAPPASSSVAAEANPSQDKNASGASERAPDQGAVQHEGQAALSETVPKGQAAQAIPARESALTDPGGDAAVQSTDATALGNNPRRRHGGAIPV